MKFLVKHSFATKQARLVTFGMHLDADLLYCGTGNNPSLADISLYLSSFLSLLSLNDANFHSGLLGKPFMLMLVWYTYR